MSLAKFALPLLLLASPAAAGPPSYFGGWGEIPLGATVTVYQVGPSQTYTTVNAACNAADADSNAVHYYVLQVASGVYAGDGCNASRSMAIIGANPLSLPLMDDTAGNINNDKGIYYHNSGSIYIDSVAFKNYGDSSGNGAALRDQSPTGYCGVFVNNTNVTGTEMGYLTEPDFSCYQQYSNNLISNIGNLYSQIAHDFYMGGSMMVVIRDTEACGSLHQGNTVKSRAASTLVFDSALYTAAPDPNQPNCQTGDGSYSVDISNGGRVILENNTITHGAYNNPAGNGNILTQGAEGNLHTTNSYTITGNTVVGTPDLNMLYIGAAATSAMPNFQGAGNTVPDPILSLYSPAASGYNLLTATTGPYGVLSVDGSVSAAPSGGTAAGLAGNWTWGTGITGGYTPLLNGTANTSGGAGNTGATKLATDYGGRTFGCFPNAGGWLYFNVQYNTWFSISGVFGANPAWGTCP
jgi:hypothetical protein